MDKFPDEAIVRIYTGQGTVAGAGFLVTGKHLMTCAHVVAAATGYSSSVASPPPEVVQLDFPLLEPGTRVQACVVEWNPLPDGRTPGHTDDVAVLELLDEPPVGAIPVRLIDASELWGHRCRAYGFPINRDDGIWAPGILRGKTAQGWVQLDGVDDIAYFVQRGFSGGPVWDEVEQGVVGMVVAADQRETVRSASLIPTKWLHKAWPPLAEHASATKPPPYLGLHTFHEEHAHLFFGREALEEELVQHVEASPFLAVLGPSGSGKSSVVRAGLIPRLKRWKPSRYVTDQYLILDPFQPGESPLDTLATVLAKFQPGVFGSATDISDDFRNGKLDLLRAASMLRADQPDARLLIVVDQFEQLWTWTKSPDDRRLFIQLLLSALPAESAPSKLVEPQTLTTPRPNSSRGRSPLTVVLTMRSDFFRHRAMEHPELVRAIDEYKVNIRPMTEKELKRAIEKPAHEAGGSVEKRLMAELIKQTLGREGALPLLEDALLELWKAKRPDGTMMLERYDEIGGVEGALPARAEHILKEEYTREGQDKLGRLLPRLVEPGKGTLDLGRRVSLNDMRPAGAPADEVRDLLQPLVDGRLLTVDVTERGEETVEFSHEALLSAWRTLRVWINEVREDLPPHRQLERAAKEWKENGHNPGYLWHGDKLAEAIKWAKQTPLALSANEVGFLQESREEEKKRKQGQRWARFAGRLAAFLALLTAFALLLLWQANRNQTLLEAARTEAEALKLAFASLTEQEVNAERAHLLAIEANRLAYTPVGDQAIRTALRRPNRPVALFTDHEGRINSATWSPDGSRILSASNDGTARIWEATSSAELVVLRGHETEINSASWSPHGSRIVTAGNDGTARVWESASGTELLVLHGHEAEINSAAWSPDGSRILTASDDGTARIWESASGAELVVLNGYEAAISSAAWSPDGSRILIVRDKTVGIWESASGVELVVLHGHKGGIKSATWSPDGARILTASYDDTVRVWETALGTELDILGGHEGWMDSAIWSPRGSRILTTDNDTASVWSASGGELAVLRGHEGGINSAIWSPDGSYILTASDDGTTRVWEAARGVELIILRGHEGGIVSAVWSPDGEHILTVSNGDTGATFGDDGTARVWKVGSGAELTVLNDYVNGFGSAAWSPDGSRILTTSSLSNERGWGATLDIDGTVRVWKADTGAVLTVLSGHESWVNTGTWSPDGLRILTTSWDSIARVWDAVSGAEMVVMHGHEGRITSAAWSPDGTRILSTDAAGTIHVWDPLSGNVLVRLNDDEDIFVSATWSPDGTHILTAGSDGTIQVWNVTSEDELTVLSVYETYGEWDSFAWSPDGERILTVTDISAWSDSIVRVWDVASGTELLMLDSNENGSDIFTSAAWSPNGSNILTVSGDSTANVWDATTGDAVTTMRGHDGSLNSAIWSPDGTHILTFGFDGTVHVWDASSGNELAILRGHEYRVASASWSPDGTRILTASSDGTARIYYANIEDLLRVACERAVRNLSHDEWAQFIGGDVPYRETCPGKPVPGVDYAVNEG